MVIVPPLTSVNHLGVILLLVLGPELLLTHLLVHLDFVVLVMQSSCCLCGAFSVSFAAATSTVVSLY